MDRKRPRRDQDALGTPGGPPSTLAMPSSSSSALALSSAPSSSSASVQLLEAELRTLRTELEHSQTIRSIERKNAERSESRLRRRLDDAFEESKENQELVDSLRDQVDLHGRRMEETRQEWLDRIRWYEERWEEDQQRLKGVGGAETDWVTEAEREKNALLQAKLDASTDQAEDLTRLVIEAEERAATAEQKASQLELEASTSPSPADENRNDENADSQQLRALRIKLAESGRDSRELQRERDEWKDRAKDAAQHREKAGSAQRRVRKLEEELRDATRQCEEGKEAKRIWAAFRKEVVEDTSLVSKEGEDVDADVAMASEDEEDATDGDVVQPPELATVVRKFQGLKRTVRRLEDDNRTVVRESEARKRRIQTLEQREREQSRATESMEKEIAEKKEAMDRLDLNHRKLVAQQKIWERESEGMRSLLDTFDREEDPTSKRRASDAMEGGKDLRTMQVTLTSAKEQATLLTENNERLQTEIDGLRTQQEEAKEEHERVLDKFKKIRAALMEERSKAEASETRACLAETLAGKGSYNEETTRVVHLESNPFADAVREKHRTEMEALTRRLEEAEEALRNGSSAGTPLSSAITPAPRRGRSGSGIGVGSTAKKDYSVDAQKLHRRLKERFKEQIALFREGVFLITGFKVDMQLLGDNGDRPTFKVRSVYAEREEDHLSFEWPRKADPSNDQSLDLLSTELAQVLMNGPSAIYMTKYDSVPAFIAAVQLSLFENQTMI